MSFIFGGDTGATYEQVQRRRQLAQQLMAQGAAGTPRNVGEGISSFAKSITGALVGRKAAKRDDELRAESKDLWDNSPVAAYLNGGSMPSYTSPSPTGAPVTPVATAPLQDTPQAIGNDAMAAIGQPSNDPATRIRNGLTERGLPPHVADAFVMNFQDESNLDPGINEIEPMVPGSRGGFGLAQWTGPRRRALEQFAQERGMPVSDENLQMDFLMQELQGPESRAAQTIMSSRDAPTAAAAIVNDFLRPAEVNRARREAQYTGGATPQGQGGGRPNVSTQQIVELLSNPYIAQDPAKAAVLQSLLQQNLAGPQQPDLTSAQREYQMAQSQGFEGSFLDYKTALANAGRTSITNTVGGEAAGPELLGTAGLVAIPDPDAEGGVRVIAAEGSPMAQEQATEAAATEAERAGTIDKATGGIQLITSIMEDPALAGITGMVQGRLPPMTQGGTDLNVKIEQLQGQAFLQAFESLKGGGQITQIEGEKATAAMARLNRVQGTPAYTESLAEIRYVMQRAKQRAEGNDPGPYNFEWPPKDTPPPPGEPDADGYITLPNGVRIREVK